MIFKKGEMPCLFLEVKTKMETYLVILCMLLG
nr:MAG TPA: hypothetical protein [Caudoviricetes sp.]